MYGALAFDLSIYPGRVTTKIPFNLGDSHNMVPFCAM